MKKLLNKLKDNYSKDDIFDYISKMKDIDAIIIGETIIDEYQFGYTLGKAGKFPIVAFQNTYLETYDGGVLAIKNHLKDFCNVDIRTGWKQIVKKRYVQNGQKLFETYSTRDDLGYDETKPIEDYDLVIVADFGHGFIDEELREEIDYKAKYISLNVQMNAGNMGLSSINKYEYADYTCIDENELRLAESNQFDDIEDIIMKRFNFPQVASITLSKRGTMIYKDEKIMIVDALIHKAMDTMGAGDAYLSITSPLTYINAPAEIIGYLGNVAGAIACSYQGNKEYITKDKLIEYIEKLWT